jgi:putative endonuclease
VKTRRQTVGMWGEKLAEEYMAAHDCLILGKNIRTSYGEIDVIARRGDELIFLEVKTRTNQAYGLPETAITAKKRMHMLQAAQAYLQAHPELETLSWRIDVMAILGKNPGDPSPEIEYFENALA